MTPTHWVLEADDSILCSDPAHQAIRGLSGVVVAVFAFGLPVTFGYILLRLARSYNRETRGTNAVLARRVAEDLKVDEVSAEFVIRDVIIGEDYSFLMDACALNICSTRCLLSRAMTFACARRFTSLPVLGSGRHVAQASPRWGGFGSGARHHCTALHSSAAVIHLLRPTGTMQFFSAS